MGMVIRRDKMTPGPLALSYQSYCSCGNWRQGPLGSTRGPAWVRPKANAVKYWELHIKQVRRGPQQGKLL